MDVEFPHLSPESQQSYSVSLGFKDIETPQPETLGSVSGFCNGVVGLCVGLSHRVSGAWKWVAGKGLGLTGPCTKGFREILDPEP